MNIEKFYTKEVEIYEKVKSLNDKLSELRHKRKFIFENYDSKINVSLTASSYHNYNEKKFKEISLPIDVILGYPITEKIVLEKLDSEIKSIEKQLEDLNVEFEKLSELKGDVHAI